MCHGGTKHQQTTRTEHFYSETDATKDYFTLRKPKVPGRGGKTCRPRHDKKPWVPSEKKERFASLSRVFLQKGRGDVQHSKKILLRPEKREKKFFQRQNGQRQEAGKIFFLKTHHHRKCHPEKMMADQELNSRDGRNALRCPDNFIIPYPSPCGLLLQHRADKGQY